MSSANKAIFEWLPRNFCGKIVSNEMSTIQPDFPSQMNPESFTEQNQPNGLIAMHQNDQHGLRELLHLVVLTHQCHCNPNNGIRQCAQQADQQQSDSVAQRVDFITQLHVAREFARLLMQNLGKFYNCVAFSFLFSQMVVYPQDKDIHRRFGAEKCSKWPVGGRQAKWLSNGQPIHGPIPPFHSFGFGRM